MEDKKPTYANGKICYIEIPAKDVEISASFYRSPLDGRSDIMVTESRRSMTGWGK